MKFTNKLNLPAYLFDWLTNDDYDYNLAPNTISATSLLKPLRASVLAARHAESLEIDVSELISSRYGNAIHDSVERISTPGVSKEKRVTRQITVGGEVWTITGKYDILVDEGHYHTIRDMKTTSTWSYIHGGKDEDYRNQLSIYRWLLSESLPINPVAYIDFFFTDWQAVKARTEQKYPRSRIHAGYRINLNSVENMTEFITKKVNEIIAHRDTPDDELPECTKEELWADDDTFAVYKIGNKRATKVCDSQKEADDYLKNAKFKGLIQKRPGQVKRCKYCSVTSFCNQYSRMKAEGLIPE